MSGVGTSSSPGGPPSFFSLLGAASLGRKSATAAAITTASASSAASRTAIRISSAVPTSTRRGPSGGWTVPGPTTSVTSAPRANASRATAKPIRPVERFPTNRTGSMGSHVGPAVTTIRRPARSRPRDAASSTAARMSSGSAIRPTPSSPAASGPLAGPTTTVPRSSRARTLAWVAGCSHMTLCMAGATTSGQVASRRVEVSRSSAIPPESLAMTFAVAGATTATSAPRASRTCNTEPGSSHTSV